MVDAKMVDAAASWAVGTLRDITIEEVKFLYGVKDRVADLERDLQRMRDFLEDADKWPERYDSATVRRRVSDFIDLATMAEDVLEEYAVKVTSKRGERNLKEMLERFTCILCECWDVRKIGKEIEVIMSCVAELTKDLQSIRSTSSVECNDDQRLQLQRRTYGHVIDQEYFVGMKNDIDRLVLHMKNIDDISSRVISICGMGGLGKTTLARKIYQHKDIPFSFEARAWVCITQKLQAKVIFQEILRQLLSGENKERVTRMEETELVRELYAIQKEKKCLVVLDDIWEIDHWNYLKNAFPIEESNSKILLTTRIHRVAVTAGSLYELDFLTEDESWDLLKKIALPIQMQSEAYSKQFEAIGRELVRKCGRLPLAVSKIGEILRGRQNLGDWNEVLENMGSYLKHGTGGVANDKRVEQVLNLSYNMLPYHLKLCFLYLGCFPEDKDINVEDVYLIWMAEGLISSDDKGRNETLRDVAVRYLNELASKCMVQVKIMSTEGFKSCRLHDLVRDLCLSKGKKERFFEVSERKIRRLAINLGDTDACSVAQFKKANLRSLLLLSKSSYDSYDITDIWKNLLSNALLKYLKVLVLENCRFEDDKLPHDVRKLMRLKHLGIRCSYVGEVPEFVCKLQRLQSLDLRSAIDITLPNSIGKMERLRHLFLKPSSSVIDDGRLGLEGLTEMETLIGFSSRFCHTEHLLKLTNLRRLGGSIYDIESLSVVVDHMTELKDQLREVSLEIFVEDLTSEEGSLLVDCLMHCRLNYLSIHGKLRRLPTWDPQLLQNLHTLSLFYCNIVEDPMETLQRLLTLRSLSLGDDAFVGTEMVCGSEGFPELKSLKLKGLRNLVGWRVEEEAMPNLSDLSILDCPKLERIPERMISMTNLTISGG